VAVGVVHVESLTVERIAAGGDGVARGADGRVVFLPHTAPGDQVEAEVRAQPGARFARGRVRRLLTPGPGRADPPCPHYADDGCGGCQLQHLVPEAQRAAKAALVADAFARIARRPLPPPEVVASPSPWRYRRKATFTLRPGGGGFHAADDPDRLVAVSDCLITEPAVIEALLAVRAARAWLPEAPEWRVSARRLDDGAVGVVVEEGAGPGWAAFPHFIAQLPTVSALWWRPTGASRPRALLDRRPGGRDAAPAFVQVHADLAGQLAAYVEAQVADVAPATIVDAFAGSGAGARALADRTGARVAMIERDAIAAEIARGAAHPMVAVHEGAVEALLAGLLPADVVVLNPPRGGLEARVPALLDSQPGVRRIVYVSCDPATLARDVARLPHWGVTAVRCFDLFPQTAHVETVVTLAPAGATVA
jgi:23S rRNA (uracil1939-C5)-methyltransferase